MKNNFKVIIFYIVLIAIIVVSVSMFFKTPTPEKLEYSDIVEYFKTDSVVSFNIDEDNNLTMKIVDKDSSQYDENGIVI